jgi:type 1 glutamine amidotransferase
MKLTMKSIFKTSIVSLLLAGLTATAAEPKKVLVVTTTTGFRHSSIPTAEKILNKLGNQSHVYTVEYARVEPNSPEFQNPTTKKPDDAKVKEAIGKVLAEKMSAEALKTYDAIIFANTTGDLPLPDKEAFLAWIKSGKAFIGMHSCTDTFHGWPAYIEMLGGEFKGHNAQVGVECMNMDPGHPANVKLGKSWVLNQEEIYLMKNYDASKCHPLLVLDKHPNDKTPGHYPISWCKKYGEGRVFYTSIGHREDIWDDETDPGFKRENTVEIARAYQRHILGGIKWAMGLEPDQIKP